MKKKEWKEQYYQASQDAFYLTKIAKNLNNENIALREENKRMKQQLEEVGAVIKLMKADALHLIQEKLAAKKTPASSALAIKSIEWLDDATVIHWTDGTFTKVTRQKGEKADRQTAVAYAIAKKVLGNHSISDVIEFYSEDHTKDEKYAKIYLALNSKSKYNRVKALRAWEKIPEAKRQSIKAMVKQNA